MQVWNNVRVSKEWQNRHFWVNYPFNCWIVVNNLGLSVDSAAWALINWIKGNIEEPCWFLLYRWRYSNFPGCMLFLTPSQISYWVHWWMGHVQPHLIKLSRQKKQFLIDFICSFSKALHFKIMILENETNTWMFLSQKYLLGWWVINEVMKEEDKTCFLTAAGWYYSCSIHIGCCEN